MKSFLQKIIFASGILIVLYSCENDSKKAVVIDETMTTADDFKIEQDTTVVKVLKLPVYIDSTQYLYHPVALERVFTTDDNYSLRSYKSAPQYWSSKYSNYTFSGSYANFTVENMATGKKVSVIKDQINISQVNIYNKLDHNPRVEFVLYQGNDLDTNKDQKLDNQDIQALFISNIDGTDFKKLSLDFEELVESKFIVENDKLYFQTQKDTNENGIFENEDGFRNYYVDLTKAMKEAIRYDQSIMKKTQP